LFQRRGSANLGTLIVQGFNCCVGSAVSTGGTAGATNVFANVSQGGLGGTISIRQEGSNLNATVEQNNGEFLTAGRTTNSDGTAIAGVVVPSVRISQVGNLNTARVTQTGSNSDASVDQRNRNTNTSLPSSVTIIQSGGSVNGSNTARALQTREDTGQSTIAASGANSQTGPTGDAETRLAGSSSGNIIEINQTNQSTGTTATTGGNNSATVEQRGAGQVGRIFQTGFRNEAGILQELAATNSTAIITQTGSNNTFFVTQNSPNQFIRVNQTGGNNQTVTGTGTGLGGTVSNTTSPTFTAAP
jgi:hypothetical protein